MYSYGRGFSGIPPVVKNLILINAVMLVATLTAGSVMNVDLINTLGLHFPKSELFRPYQIITHMFMHGSPQHLIFNMLALFMFGRVLETVWGPKRFFIYYVVTGLGAAFVHLMVIWIQYSSIAPLLSPEALQDVLQRGAELMKQNLTFRNELMAKMNSIVNTPTVGASGAIFGILMAFGVLFPNTRLMLLFPPIPIKAKYIAVLALILGVLLDFRGNVAHFAHLGGMIFGYILIRVWRKTTNTLY